MTSENIKRLREEVERRNWTIIWAGAEMPCEFLDEPVELIYEDNDGSPCICNAIYTYDKDDTFYRTPYFKRDDGVRMSRCIAWRKRQK